MTQMTNEQDQSTIKRDQIDVEWLILADAAQMVQGKLYLLGGGWDQFAVHSGFPIQHNMAIAVAFRVPWNLANRKHSFEIEIQNEDATQELAKVDGVFEVGRLPGMPAGRSQLTQLVINASLKLEKPGTNVIIARVNDIEHRTSFTVLDGKRPMTRPMQR